MLVGSNGFNLAAMIGLSALLTGRVRLSREVLLLEGMVGLAITVVAARCCWAGYLRAARPASRFWSCSHTSHSCSSAPGCS